MIVRGFTPEALLIGDEGLQFFTAEHVTTNCVSWFI